jgi:hypothetical protein
MAANPTIPTTVAGAQATPADTPQTPATNNASAAAASEASMLHMPVSIVNSISQTKHGLIK